MAGIIAICLSLTSCEDYVNRSTLDGNWVYLSDTVRLEIAFAMNEQFGYFKEAGKLGIEGEYTSEAHYGHYTCTDSTFYLNCNVHSPTETCTIMDFTYIMTQDGMLVTDEEGQQYLMKK